MENIMDENQFWIKIWSIIAICFCVLTLSISGCNINKHEKISEAVKQGSDPIAASCMFQRSNEDAVCIAYLMKAK